MNRYINVALIAVVAVVVIGLGSQSLYGQRGPGAAPPPPPPPTDPGNVLPPVTDPDFRTQYTP